GLLLSSYDRRGRPRSGWLTAKEVRELDLETDVVVLSACRTGLGRQVRGEGLVGLSYSFLAAGASSVVASLWNVDDRATAALMGRFHRELLGGRPPAEALRAAQLHLRDETRWSAPYYWGGFVLQGDGLNNARSGGSP
ncbi:MAG: CHAT domain-containing protein, partial [Thermoanaerobaculia bacterium]